MSTVDDLLTTYRDHSQDQIKARVHRGMALLDVLAPGWEDKIPVRKLDLSSGTYCALGLTWLKRNVLDGATRATVTDLVGDRRGRRWGFFALDAALRRDHINWVYQEFSRLGLARVYREHGAYDAVRYGFEEMSLVRYERLTEVWQNAIADRHAVKQVRPTPKITPVQDVIRLQYSPAPWTDPEGEPHEDHHHGGPFTALRRLFRRG